MINSRKAIFAILNAYSPPNVWMLCGETQFCAEKVPHSLRPLGQDLIGMPTRSGHDFSHCDDIIIGHISVKKVAHRINKYHLRSLPANWLPGSICPLDLRVVAHFGVSISLRGARNPQF